MITRSLPVLAVVVAFWTAPLAAAEPANVEVKVAPDDIVFLAGKDLVTRYHFGPKSADLSKPYFWPVYAVGDIPLTRAWPMEKGQPQESTDHPHHKSIWFGHGGIIAEGLSVPAEEKPAPDKRDKSRGGKKDKPRAEEGIDFWAEGKGHGRIVCTKVDEPKMDKNHGWVTTQNEWRTADGTKVMDETRTIHLYDFGDTRLLVLDIDLHASVAPITFADTKEGSMALRVNDLIRQQGGKGTIENADGKKGESECWGRIVRLVRLFGAHQRQDGWHCHPGRSEQPGAGLLAQPRLRPDGSQPLRPEEVGLPGHEGPHRPAHAAPGEST